MKRPNPLVVKVALENVRKQLLNFRIALFELDEGADCQEFTLLLNDQVYIIAKAFELLGKTDTLEYRKLKSASKALVDCCNRGFTWRKSDAVTLDNAVEIFADHVSKIPIKTIIQATEIFQKELR